MQKVIALGFFDGVHLGHGALLRRTRELAAQYGAQPAALTFDRSPGKDGKLLTSVADRIFLIRTLYGIEDIIVLPFDEKLRQTPWDVFLRNLTQTQNAVCFVCGYDCRFGSGAAGNPERLQAFCNENGLGCEVVPAQVIDGITVSSTYLRQRVAAGQMAQAAGFYGHPHTLSGGVVRGRQLGRRLGTPTANIAPDPGVLLPQNGVYAVRAYVDGASHTGVCNIGTRPTVDGRTVTVEVWLPEETADLYGRQMRLEFYEKLRDEQKFPSLDALRAQILRDAAQAKAYFENLR